MRFDEKMLRLYAVTDRHFVGRLTLMQQIEAALKGGVAMVQLREKELDDESFTAEALEAERLCKKYGAALIINDRADIALKIGADGVHVGIEDTPVSQIRRNAPEDFIIGATAKTVQQAQEAERQGADYLGVGAVFPSPTKKNAVRITSQQLRRITESVSIPCAAIGGITLENAKKLTGCGAKGIAVVSALFGAEDIEKAARELLRIRL